MWRVPYHHQTHNGHRSFLTIVDDFSRATWLQLMSKKSHAFPLLRAFILLIEKKFPIHLQSIRSDNYMVFSEKNATNSYESNGIIHQVSCVEGQEENYVVEPKHKHLQEVGCESLLS